MALGVTRRARNKFQWGPSGSIPTTGGPGDLIYEIHRFGQVFSGCFYDTIINVFGGMASQTQQNLWKSTKTVGDLLVKAIKQAPVRSQYFREVGRFVVLIDEQENGGANRMAIRDAFQSPNIALGSSLALAPQLVVAGNALREKLATATKHSVLSAMGAKSARAKSSFGTAHQLLPLSGRQLTIGPIPTDIQ